MIRCRTCLYPTTKPDLHFDETGECSACRSYKARPEIDWDARKQQLIELLDRHDGRCIVPSSGGKDSTAQVVKLKQLGAHVTAVTATTCHLTPIGRANIDNLARIADETIEVTPNRAVRAKLNRLGLGLVGDISWPEHVAIFTTPFRVACDLQLPLIFYGENPQNQYGGPQGSEEAMTMTRRWVSEFGGFLGLRTKDLIGMEGLTSKDIEPYTPPSPDYLDAVGVEAHFLGQYLPWDSHENASIAMNNGMRVQMPTPANWWTWENLDNAQTGLHDYMMWLKYGYGRACAQLSVDIRQGRVSRELAERQLKVCEGLFPHVYAGVKIIDVIYRIGVSIGALNDTLHRYTNRDIHPGPLPYHGLETT